MKNKYQENHQPKRDHETKSKYAENPQQKREYEKKQI